MDGAQQSSLLRAKNLANQIKLEATGGGSAPPSGSAVVQAGPGITVTNPATDTYTVALTSPVSQSMGGTGFTSYTDGQLLVGSSVSGGLVKTNLTAGQNVAITNAPGAVTVGLTGVVPVANGGTSFSSFAPGQTILGKADGTLAKATITAGTGISVTPGDGTLTIAQNGNTDPLIYDNAYEKTVGHGNTHWNNILAKQNVDVVGVLKTDTLSSHSGAGILVDGSVTERGNIVPETTNLYNLGSDGSRFQSMYANNLQLGPSLTTNYPSARLNITGADASGAAFPGYNIYTSADDKPLFTNRSFQHGDISLSFDSYYSSGWKSSNAAGSHLIAKSNGDLVFFSGSAIPGTPVTFSNAMIINSLATVSIPKLLDTTSYIINSGDISKRIAFSAVSISPGTTRTLTSPDASGVIVLDTATQTLSNKNLIDASTTIINSADNTKKVRFDASGITTGITRVMTFPNANATLVGETTSQFITNKIMSYGNSYRDVLPFGDNTYNLGATNNKWANLNVGAEIVGITSQPLTNQEIFNVVGTDNGGVGSNATQNFYTSADNNPLLAIRANSHDDISIGFDTYYDGGSMSSSVNSNFLMAKDANNLNFYCSPGAVVGTTVAWTNAMAIGKDATVIVPKILDYSRIVDSTDNTKKIAFSAANITTGTTRTLTSPNTSGTVAVYSGAPTVGYVLTSTSTSGDATWQAPSYIEPAPGSSAVFFDDFKGVTSSLPTSLNSNEVSVGGDQAWLLYSNVVSELTIDPLYAATSFYTGTMVGALYPRFGTPTANTERGYALNNSTSYSLPNGTITFECRLKIQTLASPIAQQRVFVGLGSLKWTSILTSDMAPCVGFSYSSSSDANWAVLWCTTYGTGSVSFPTSVAATGGVVKLKFTIAPDGTTTFYIDGIQVYSVSLPTTGFNSNLLAPRLMHAYTKDTNPIGAGVGVLYDYVYVKQNFVR